MTYGVINVSSINVNSGKWSILVEISGLYNVGKFLQGFAPCAEPKGKVAQIFKYETLTKVNHFIPLLYEYDTFRALADTLLCIMYI